MMPTLLSKSNYQSRRRRELVKIRSKIKKN